MAISHVERPARRRARLRVTLAASAAALVVLATGLPEWPLLVALAAAYGLAALATS
jgi:uncharacterized membrane protein YccC